MATVSHAAPRTRLSVWVLAVALAGEGCRTGAEFTPLSGGTGVAGIGDSVCGMLARMTFEVVDAEGAPVQDAEIWQLDEPRAVPPLPVTAERFGRTDGGGSLVSSHCFAGFDDVTYWSSLPNPTRLSFLVLHDALGVRRKIVEPR